VTHQMHPPSRHPANKNGRTHEQQDMRHLVAQFPCVDLALPALPGSLACGIDQVFPRQEDQRERQSASL